MNRNLSICRPARRGFMLIEMMVVIGLLAVVGLIAAQLFHLMEKVERESLWQQIHESQLDQAVRQLRQDVWRAGAVEVPAPGEVRLAMSDGQEIDWAMSGSLTRRSAALTEDGSTRHWKDLGVTFGFSRRGAALVVDVSQMGEPHGRLTMVSQSMLLSERPR